MVDLEVKLVEPVKAQPREIHVIHCRFSSQPVKQVRTQQLEDAAMNMGTR